MNRVRKHPVQTGSFLRKLNRDVSFLISKYNKLVIVRPNRQRGRCLHVCVCTFFLFNSRVKVTFTSREKKYDYSSKVLLATKVGREKIINKRSIAVNHPPAVTRLPFLRRRRRKFTVIHDIFIVWIKTTFSLIHTHNKGPPPSDMVCVKIQPRAGNYS